MRYECYFCHIKTVEQLIDKFKPEDGIAEEIILIVNEILKNNWQLSNPGLAALLHREISKLMNESILFHEEKVHANNLIYNKYPEWKRLIYESDDPFYMALKLAVIGNVIDYGSHSIENDIESQIKRLINKEFRVDDSDKLLKAIRSAGSILYLGDNAGEIVYDRLFIEILDHPDIIYAVRGKPVINDVTMDDAEQINLNQICTVISNGYDAPSTIVECCDNNFKKVFDDSDLVISKGQGNFEGLMDSEKENIYFLLMAKCDPIAQLLGVKKEDLIVKKK